MVRKGSWDENDIPVPESVPVGTRPASEVIPPFPINEELWDAYKPRKETDEERAERLELEKQDVLGLEEVDHVTDLPVSNDRRMVGRAQDLLGDDFEV